jgi:hypothetical protein
MRQVNAVSLCVAGILALAASGIAPGWAASPGLTVTQPSSAAASPNMSDLPLDHFRQSPAELHIVPPPKPLPQRSSGPGGPQGHIQGEPGSHDGIEPKTSFGGIGANGYIPPDPNIAVGKNDPVTGVGYIVQLVNSQFAVFDKTGKLITGPVSLSSLWSSLPGGGGCATNNAGDPVVQYDASAVNGEGRWLVTQLGSTSGPAYSECIAVSQTNNPSGAYYLYSYSFGNNLNDYPKFGVWPTATNPAYLASYNLFANGQTPAGAALCAYDRTAMLAGAASPTSICMQISNDAGFLPADLDGATPPPDATPGYFLNFETLSSLRLYRLSPDFTIPANSTLSAATPDIPVMPFSMACNGGTCVPQPNNQKLDSLGDRLMYRLAYRVFSGSGGVFDHASMVVNHSVVAGSSVGVRWYELRQTAPGGALSLYQQGQFAPDSSYRWMGSAAMDGAGNIAVGYSLSSGNIYPAIAFAARTPDLPAGTMGAEKILRSGAGAQTTYSRWGDYTSLRIDPSDDTTFWYTNEYYSRNSRLFNYLWSTAISSFTVGGGSSSDFSLAAAPNSLTVPRGGSNATTITVSGSGSPVTLSVSGLPRATSASFSSNPVTPTGSSQLTISTSRGASSGTYSIQITGNNGTTSHATALTLTIQ